MSETTNYKLYVADNDNTDFYDWWSQIGGPSGSNMEKIDTILAALDSLINTHTHNITVGISGVLGIENGGTGADNAADALVNLGIQDLIDSVAGGSGTTTTATIVPITLSVSGWSGSPLKQTVSVPGVLADETKQIIWPSPSLASQSVWVAASVMATGLADDSVVFTASETPTADIVGYVSFMGV